MKGSAGDHSLLALAGKKACVSAMALCAFLLLPACVHEGDFGRRQAPVTYDFAASKAGDYQTRKRGEPFSPYPFTDYELEMRAQAYRFIMPPERRNTVETMLHDLQWHRVFPAHDPAISGPNYYQALMRHRAQSHETYYRQISEDILIDVDLLPALKTTILRVYHDDTLRLRAGKHFDPNTVIPGSPALERLEENRLVVDSVRLKLKERYNAYTYAYKRLMIELPSEVGMETEAALERYQRAMIHFEADLANRTPGFWDKNPTVIGVK